MVNKSNSISGFKYDTNLLVSSSYSLVWLWVFTANAHYFKIHPDAPLSLKQIRYFATRESFSAYTLSSIAIAVRCNRRTSVHFQIPISNQIVFQLPVDFTYLLTFHISLFRLLAMSKGKFLISARHDRLTMLDRFVPLSF